LKTWKVTIYRRDSETPVVLENVKHCWWEDGGARFVVSVFTEPPDHYYIAYPVELISHTKVEREKSND